MTFFEQTTLNIECDLEVYIDINTTVQNNHLWYTLNALNLSIPKILCLFRVRKIMSLNIFPTLTDIHYFVVFGYFVNSGGEELIYEVVVDEDSINVLNLVKEFYPELFIL